MVKCIKVGCSVVECIVELCAVTSVLEIVVVVVVAVAGVIVVVVVVVLVVVVAVAVKRSVV